MLVLKRNPCNTIQRRLWHDVICHGVFVSLFSVLFCKFPPHLACFVLHFPSLSFSRLFSCLRVFHSLISPAVLSVRLYFHVRRPVFVAFLFCCQHFIAYVLKAHCQLFTHALCWSFEFLRLKHFVSLIAQHRVCIGQLERPVTGCVSGEFDAL